MYRNRLLISVLFFPLLYITSVRADSPYYAQGEFNTSNKGIAGSIDSNGTINEAGKGIVGSIDSNGTINEAGKGIVGSIDSNGTINEAGKGIVGRVDANGVVNAAGYGAIGSVPPGNPVLAFQMVERFQQKQAQKAQYNQQYAQQQNEAIAARNAVIRDHNYAVCREAYQLCQKPYEEVLSCGNFYASCENIREQVIADYIENGRAWHRQDCDAKLTTCNAGGDPLSCRPYWSYCADYDQGLRTSKSRQTVKLPALSTQVEDKTLDDLYQPCTEKGLVGLLDETGMIVGFGHVADNGALLLGSDHHKIGIVDERGHITMDKHIPHEDKRIIKKTAMLGQDLKDGNFLLCGSHLPPRRIGFADYVSQTFIRDNLDSKSPELIIHFSVGDKDKAAYWHRLYQQ